MTTHSSPSILAWVNCYGGWSPELRHPIETIGYDQYLAGVTDALISLKGRLQAVYVSGGMRDEHGGIECDTTIAELQRRLKAKGVTGLAFHPDPDSLTSITIARKFIQTWQAEYAACAPILFCDQARSATNAYALGQLARELGAPLPPTIDVLVPIPRLDRHPNSTPDKQAEKLKLMQERGLDEVERLELEARRSE
jgi:hypothetical protein